ncbi:MAG: hypothetical protein ABSA75_05390 [Candidatus Bathyarchaeia archaeon]
MIHVEREFSALARGVGMLFFGVQINSKKRVSGRVGQLRRIMHVDTQHVRRKMIRRLEEIFKISADYARGKVDRVIDEDGKERPLTIAERQFWARIAAYTAQIINNVAKGIDERQIDRDMDQLEEMLNKTKTANQVQAAQDGPAGKPAGA